MALPDQRERPECPEALAPSVLLVPLVCRVNKESRELKELREELVQRERKVFRDLLDLLAHQVK